MSVVSAAILIGGRARRFYGVFKPGLRVGQQTILERQLAALAEAGIEDIMLVGSAAAPLPPELRRVPDVVDGCGPLGAIYSALLAATTPVVVVLAGDLPFVPPRLIRQLMELAPTDDAAVLRTGERWQPLCAAYRRRIAPAVKARLDRGALRVAEAFADLQLREVIFGDWIDRDPDEMLINVNTPDQHVRADHHARTTS